MLPVSVEGVTWLATNYTSYSTPTIVGFLMYVLGVLGVSSFILIIAFLWVDFKENVTILYLGVCFVCCVLVFFAIAHDEKKNQEDFIPEPISYIVYIEDNADYKTLIQNYTIESEQDNLTTIVLKEN